MTQVLTKNSSYQEDFQALQKALSTREPAWLRQLREDAFSAFIQLGFPTETRGNERWKYTNPAPVARTAFRHLVNAAAGQADLASLRKLAPWDDNWTTLLFVNGRYAGTFPPARDQANGICIANLAEAIAAYPDVLQHHLARQTPLQEDAFAALNTAFLQDGAVILVPRGDSVTTPLHLLYLTTDTEGLLASYPRTLIVAGKQSKLTAIESYVGLSHKSYFTNAVSEIVAEDGAQIEHYKVLLESPTAFHVGSTRVSLAQDSAFTSVCCTTGATLARNEFHVLLDAPGSSANLKGLYRIWGNQHIDNHINIDHAKPHGFSRLYYKGILDGKSKGVFSGRVLVRQDAQKTDAMQHDKNLLLSDSAEVYTKPSLEIFADDVKCGHGAAAGEMSPDALFYMQSRGLDHDTARRILIHGFGSEILDAVRVESLKGYLDRLFSGKIPGIQFE